MKVGTSIGDGSHSRVLLVAVGWLLNRRRWSNVDRSAVCGVLSVQMSSVTGSAIVASWSLRGFGLVCSFGLCRLEEVVNVEWQVIVATLVGAFAALLTS